MADNLDLDQAIVAKDPATGEFKATPYFEDYLFKIITSLGGEGSTLIRDIEATVIDAGTAEYVFALVKSLKRQVDELINDSGKSILDSIVKQLQIDTADFVGKIKTTDYTAENKEWVEARNKTRIKLPANPLDNNQVIISNGDGSEIIMDGNGNDIKFTTTNTTLTTRRQGSSFHFQFFRDNNLGEAYWRAR